MRLFHVQDADRPMYVVAECWDSALSAWKAVVRAENDGDEGEEPDGIAMVCDSDELLLSGLERDEPEPHGAGNPHARGSGQVGEPR